jgi:hypothetical protein
MSSFEYSSFESSSSSGPIVGGASSYEMSYSSSSSSGGAALVGGASSYEHSSSSGLGGASSYEMSYSSGSSSGSGAALVGGAGSYQQSGSSSFSSGSAGAVNQIAQDLLQLNQSGRFSSAGNASASFGGASYGSSSGALVSGGSSSLVGTSSSASASASSTFLSAIEQSILRSTQPIDVNETENLTVTFQGKQESGIWANRQEVVNWRGVVPITEYVLNEDMNPEVITKRSEQQLTYIQELAIRYLRPPTPPAPGEILIQQEVNTLTPPAPPLVLRQVPARASTPEPLVIREAPPQAPVAVGRKVITISGKRLPPPPRKVIIERLAPLPSKPQSVLIERWLPYAQTKRRVIFQRSAERDAVVVKPRNVVVQWEAPQVVIKKEFKYLGVIRANPVEYVQRYGATLKVARDLPSFVLDIKTPEGIVLAADYKYNTVHELEGDVRAMQLVDLDREGLSEYRAMLAKLGITYVGAAGVHAAASQFQSSSSSFSASSAISGSGSAAFGGSSSAAFGGSSSASFSSSSASGTAVTGHAAISVVDEIFKTIDVNHNGQISVDEAAVILLRLNSRLGRRYGEDESAAFFRTLDVDRNGQLSLEEFRRAFVRLL